MSSVGEKFSPGLLDMRFECFITGLYSVQPTPYNGKEKSGYEQRQGEDRSLDVLDSYKDERFFCIIKPVLS